MDETAKPVPAQNPDVRTQRRRMRAPGRRGLPERPVRRVRVAGIGVLAEDQPRAAGGQLA
jgi:hypothetical protein